MNGGGPAHGSRRAVSRHPRSLHRGHGLPGADPTDRNDRDGDR